MGRGGHPGIERPAVETDIVAGRGAIAQLRRLAVDGQPAGTDPLLNGAARSVAGAGQQFLQS